MTTDTLNWATIVATYNEAEAALARFRDDPANDDEVEEDERLSDAESKAWWAFINAPAPDAAGMALKLRAVLELHAFELTDNADNPAFLTRLLDERDGRGGFPLVRLLQDALRISGQDSPILAVDHSAEKPWAQVAAEYRAAQAAYEAAHAGPDVDDSEADRASRAHRPFYRALLDHPIWSVEQLAEKGELIAMDCRDQAEAFRIMAADAARIAKL